MVLAKYLYYKHPSMASSLAMARCALVSNKEKEGKILVKSNELVPKGFRIDDSK